MCQLLSCWSLAPRPLSILLLLLPPKPLLLLLLPLLQILPSHPLISGVYQLLSSGALPPTHSHHPAQRGFRAFGGLYTLAAAYEAISSSTSTAAAAAAAASMHIQAAVDNMSTGGGGAAAGEEQGLEQTHTGTAAAAPPLAHPPPSSPAAAAAAPAPAANLAATTVAATTAAAAAVPGATQFSTHGLSLRSAYLTARGYEPPLTNKHPSFAGCLDYVWLTQLGLEVSVPYLVVEGEGVEEGEGGWGGGRGGGGGGRGGRCGRRKCERKEEGGWGPLTNTHKFCRLPGQDHVWRTQQGMEVGVLLGEGGGGDSWGVCVCGGGVGGGTMLQQKGVQVTLCH